MTFGRLTLGFGVLLSLVDVTFTAIWGAMHPGTPDEWLSTGDLMVMTGVAAFFVGAAFGLLVWAVWSLSSRLARRYPRRVKPPPSSSKGSPPFTAGFPPKRSKPSAAYVRRVMADGEEMDMNVDKEKSADAGLGWDRAAQDAAQAQDPDLQAPAPQLPPPGPAGQRPRWQLGLSVLSMIFAIVVGVFLLLAGSSGFFCSTITRFSGANIATAGKIAVFGGIFGLLASLIASRWGSRALSSVLLVEVATLGAAIGFVARDSAVAKSTEDCGFLFSSDVSTSTNHVEYAYVLLGLAIFVLLVQAARGWGEPRPRHAAAVIVAVVSIALLAAVLPGYGRGEQRRSTGQSTGHMPPKGILVCRAFSAPEVFGGPQCDQDVDVGQAPIRPAEGLECSTDLSSVKGKLVGIQVFYGGTLIKHATIRSSDSETSPYAFFDSNDVDWLAGSRLPIGRYRCRFLVNGKLVRERTVRIGLPFAAAPLRYHYRLALATDSGARRPGPTRFGEDFTVMISSNDVPAHRAVALKLCVNHTRGEACSTYYLIGGKSTGVYWEVDRGEGAGNLYRLSVRVRGRNVAQRELRLLRNGRRSGSTS